LYMLAPKKCISFTLVCSMTRTDVFTTCTHLVAKTGSLFNDDEVPQNCDVGMPDCYSRFPYLTLEDGDYSLRYKSINLNISNDALIVR
jgi:hypothetical protein